MLSQKRSPRRGGAVRSSARPARGIFFLTSENISVIIFNGVFIRHAGMAELADAHGSGPCDSNIMRVQVPFPALIKKPWNIVFTVFQGFLH